MVFGSSSSGRNPARRGGGAEEEAAAAAALRRQGRRMKPFEHVGMMWLSALTAAAFALLLCLVYLSYGGGGGGGGRGRLGIESEEKGTRSGGGGDGGGGGGGGGGGARVCDVFEGRWELDEESYPLYESKDCPFLDEGFRCSENGRPDRFYTKWGWRPSHCDLPRFNATKMLELLRNKRLVFVGDSIGRNQWESLLCMLSTAVADKNSSIYEVNGNPITKHMGFLVFKFRDYNCTVEYYRAPFIVVQSRAPAGVPEKVKTTLKLDVLDWSSPHWKDADVLIFNTGHWWNYEKTIRGGCFFQEGNEVKMRMSVDAAYERAIETVFNWIRREVNRSKTQVIFRTYAPVHFRGGDWKMGGSCHMETFPELLTKPSTNPWAHLLKPFTNPTRSGGGTSVPLELVDVLNVTEMTARRKDGHLSVFYLGASSGPAPLHRQDCSHWCLPGVPDAWNELLYYLVLKRADRSVITRRTS